MPSCVFVGCTSSTKKNKSCGLKVRFFKFPNRTNRALRFREWITAVKRGNLQKQIDIDQACVCSEHFDDEDYDLSEVLCHKTMTNAGLKKNGPKLRLTAIPKYRDHVKNINERITKTATLKKSFNETQHLPGESCMSSALQYSTDCGVVKELCAPSTSQPQPFLPNEILNVESIDIDDSENNLIHNLQNTSNKDVFYDAEDSVCSEGSSKGEDDSDYEDSYSNISSDNESEYEYESKNKNNISSYSTLIVFMTSLLPLFDLCHICGAKTSQVFKKEIGANLQITTHCDNKHVFVWNSQPMHKTRPLGNVIIAAATLLCGLPFQTYLSFSRAMNMLSIGPTTFHSIIKKFVAPVVKNKWMHHRQENINELNQNQLEIKLGGDAQYDSPGHCADLCIYTIMCLITNKIIDFVVIKRGSVPMDLEKSACSALLTRLSKSFGLKFVLFLTDRHTGVRKLMKDMFPKIIHEFDIWHLCKSLVKKLSTILKSMPMLHEWKQSVINHIWYCCETCKCDENLLIEKYKSLLNHICNKHEWNDGTQLSGCSHQPLPAGELRFKKWLTKESDEYKALRKAMLNTRFIKDLKQAKHYCHTGELESFHNVRLKYAPKKHHIPFYGMQIRSILAVLDHNNNLNKKVISTKKIYSKGARKIVDKNIYEKTSDHWRLNLMEEIICYTKNPNPLIIEENIVFESTLTPYLPVIPDTTPSAPPTTEHVEEIIQQRSSRRLRP